MIKLLSESNDRNTLPGKRAMERQVAMLGRCALAPLIAVLISVALASCTSGAVNPTRASVSPGSSPTPSLSPLLRSAQLLELTQEVQVRPTGNTNWQAATEGEQLGIGDGVRTGAASRARVDISDGMVILVGEDTIVFLTALSPALTDPVTYLSLETGRLWVSVLPDLGNGSFEIATPTGVATVRGGLMSAAYDLVSGKMTVTCLEGIGRLTGAGGQFIDLSRGEQVEIPGLGQAPTAAHPIDATELAAWAQAIPGSPSLVAPAAAAPSATVAASATPTSP
jgi:hypothetical protein